MDNSRSLGLLAMSLHVGGRIGIQFYLVPHTHLPSQPFVSQVCEQVFEVLIAGESMI